MEKSELIDWLQAENRQWQALLAQIDLPGMDQPGVNGDWSMKDMVAHLTGWNRWLVIRMRAAQSDEPEKIPPWPAHLQAEDDINAWIYESNRARPVRQVLVESQQVFQQLLAVIADLPDGFQIEPDWRIVQLGGDRFPAGEFFDHYHDEHEADVLAWLARAEN